MQIQCIETFYECRWQTFKEENPDLVRQFWLETGLPKLHPLIRLVPKSALMDGFLETYKLKSVPNENETINYVDAKSLYSFIAMSCNLPLGSYKTLTFFDLKDNVSMNDLEEMFCYKGESMQCNIAMVEVLAPSSLHRPF